MKVWRLVATLRERGSLLPWIFAEIPADSQSIDRFDMGCAQTTDTNCALTPARAIKTIDLENIVTCK